MRANKILRGEAIFCKKRDNNTAAGVITMSGKRFEWVDSLRGVAMIAIICGHPAANPGMLSSLCYSFHVPLFFMISGALFHAEKYRKFIDCLKKYFASLLLPYFLLYSINIPLWYINWRVIGDSSSSGDSILAGLYYANQLLKPMANGALWFLPTLFLTTVATWLVYRVLEKDEEGCLNPLVVALVCLCVGCFLKICDIKTLPWTLNAVPLCMFFFLLGGGLMPYAIKLSNSMASAPRNQKLRIAVLGIVIALLGLIVAMYSVHISGENVSLMRNDVGLPPIGLMAAVVISSGIAMVLIASPTCQALRWFGSNTLGSLAFHVPVMRFIENGLNNIFDISPQPVLVALVVIALMFPINWLINRYTPVLVGKTPISFN